MTDMGLTGLTGLAQYQQVIDENSQATPEERSGNAVDERHGHWGEQAAPYPWESSLSMGGSHGPYGPENQLLGDEWWFTTPAGSESDDITFDRTPSKRAGPFPKGVASGPVPGENPDDIAEQLRQSQAIHAINTGSGLKSLYPVQALGVQQDEWEEIWEVNPGSVDLAQVPNQMKSSGFTFGTTDRTQSFARQNQYGFDSKHQKRRFATGSIPGNTDWMRPGGRPLQKSLPGPSRPAIGQDSPFHGDDLGAAFGVQGAVLQNQPTEYVPPAQPNLAPAYPAETGLEAVVEWY
jgi:hypothetical protein